MAHTAQVSTWVHANPHCGNETVGATPEGAEAHPTLIFSGYSVNWQRWLINWYEE